MSNNENYAKAYKEVTEILKSLPQEDVDKIPAEMLETFESLKDSNYEFEFIINENGEEPKLLEETEAIIYNLYKDYWSSSEERDILEKIEKVEIELQDIEKNKKYNSSNIFERDSTTIKQKSENKNETTELQIIEEKENVFIKFIKFIKNIFTKK